MTAIAYTCPRCKRTSHNPHDASEGWCASCKDWTNVFFDRQGCPITDEEWVKLTLDRAASTVAEEDLGEVHLVTYWSGVNHNSKRPEREVLIFETLALKGPGPDTAADPFMRREILYSRRAPDKRAARANHATVALVLVAAVRAGIDTVGAVRALAIAEATSSEEGVGGRP